MAPHSSFLPHQQQLTPTHVWQMRTNKIVAMAIIIIGLTMMISTVPQCIYIGLVFIVMALGWLSWMRLKERQTPLPTGMQPGGSSVSPVLFLVTSHNMTPRPCGPTPANPYDKPPTYEQVLKLDGLPPDYLSIIASKPPRYEDLQALEHTWIQPQQSSPHAADSIEPQYHQLSTNQFIDANASCASCSTHYTMENPTCNYYIPNEQYCPEEPKNDCINISVEILSENVGAYVSPFVIEDEVAVEINEDTDDLNAQEIETQTSIQEGCEK